MPHPPSNTKAKRVKASVTAHSPDTKETLEVPLAYKRGGLGVAHGVCFHKRAGSRIGDWYRIYHIASGMAFPLIAPLTVTDSKWVLNKVLQWGFDWKRPASELTTDPDYKSITKKFSELARQFPFDLMDDRVCVDDRPPRPASRKPRGK